MPWNFTSFFQELLPDNRVPLLGNYDQAWLTAAEGLACTAAAAYAPPGERNARSLIAIDADRSQIRSAQREELAHLELGDVSGYGGIALGLEIPLASEGAAQCRY